MRLEFETNLLIECFLYRGTHVLNIWGGGKKVSKYILYGAGYAGEEALKILGKDRILERIELYKNR